MRALLQGAAAGYGIAIPVGPIAVLIVERGLRRGFRTSFAAGLGAAAADLTYATVAVLAGVAATSLLVPFAEPLRVIAALVLLGFAIRGLWTLRGGPTASGPDPTTETSGGASPASDDTGGASEVRTFASLYGLTLLNPITVAYFAALVLGGAAVGTSTAGRSLFVLGAFMASLSWQTLLAGIGAVGARRLTARARVVTGLLGNLVVLGLGLRMLLG